MNQVSRMKRIILLVMITSVPVYLCLQVWEVVRYTRLTAEVGAMELEQGEWLDRNKKILANISLFQSPERIEKLAKDSLNLEFIPRSEILRVEIP